MKSFGDIFTGVIVPASALLPVIAGLIFYKTINLSLKTLVWYLIVSQLINITGILISEHYSANPLFLQVYIVIEVILILLYAYIRRIKKAKSGDLIIYPIIAQTAGIIGIILSKHKNFNLPLLHLYTMVELVLLLLYFRRAWGSEKVNRWTMIIMIAFPVLCIINFTFFQSIYQFNTYTRPLEALIIIVFSSLYLAYQSDIKKTELITRSGRIVAGGLLLYFCSSLFQFIFSNVVSHNAPKSVKLMIWNIHATFVLIEYLFFFAAILNERNKR